jgi:hypothetical protein
MAVTISSSGLLYPCPGEPVNVKLKIDQQVQYNGIIMEI